MERAPTNPQPKKIPWSMVAIFVLLIVAVQAAGSYSYATEKHYLEQTTQNQLTSLADLKVQQISTWIKERRGDAQMVLENPLFAEQAQQVLVSGTSSNVRQDILTWMSVIQQKGEYKQVFLIDLKGYIQLASPQNTAQPTASSAVMDLFNQAIKSQQVVSSDLYPDPSTHQVFIDLVIPLIINQGQDTMPVGALVLRIDPDQFLFPLLQTSTLTGNTSELFLVEQDGSNALFLSYLRFRTDPPLTLRMPLTSAPAIISQAAAGQEGLTTGLDYRNITAVAAIRKVPDTKWTLVTKEDQQEIYTPLTDRETTVLIMLALVMIGGCLTIGLIWRQREATFYKTQYRSEIDRQTLNEHVDFLTRYANDIILLMDENWTIVEANNIAESSYGYSQNELKWMNFRDLQGGMSSAEFAAQVEELRKRGGIVFETIQRRKDLTTFPVECSARMLKNKEKTYYQCIIRDISERRMAEQELRDSERRFRLFYEQAPVAYQSLDNNACLVEVNHAWTKLMGYSADSVIGKPFTGYLSPDSRARFETAFSEFRITGELHGEEFELERADGNQIVTALYGKASYDEHGNIHQAQCILHDITETKVAEEKNKRMNEELERRVLERTSQLEAANRELEAFSYSVSHDLRAPLRAIDGFSRILTEEYSSELSGEAQHYLERVRENTHTMSNLIDNLLSFSRLSRQPLKKQSIDPKPLVEQSLELLTSDRDSRDIRIDIHDLPPCEADPTLLKQVFVNLLSNAIKFTSKKEHAIIEVGCLAENNENIYYVRDNGVGFDMQYAHKLFGVFQRLHRTEEYEGTGVGLAIVQRIIFRHGGRIWAMSEPDKGATFCFTLKGSDGNG
jgi:PAS domain S-box-containing protein